MTRSQKPKEVVDLTLEEEENKDEVAEAVEFDEAVLKLGKFDRTAPRHPTSWNLKPLTPRKHPQGYSFSRFSQSNDGDEEDDG